MEVAKEAKGGAKPIEPRSRAPDLETTRACIHTASSPRACCCFTHTRTHTTHARTCTCTKKKLNWNLFFFFASALPGSSLTRPVVRISLSLSLPPNPLTRTCPSHFLPITLKGDVREKERGGTCSRDKGYNRRVNDRTSSTLTTWNPEIGAHRVVEPEISIEIEIEIEIEFFPTILSKEGVCETAR